MERPTRIVASALLLNALLFGLVFAQAQGGNANLNKNNSITGAVNSDEYFVGSVFFQGVTLPNTLDGSSGESVYDFEGAGTVTVASQFGGGFPRIVLQAGGTISSTRNYDQEDINREWWEGYFYAPGLGSTNVSIEGINSIHGDNIASFIVEGAFELGDSNETFSFSPAATFVADVGRAVSDGSKLYLATKSDGKFMVETGTYCWVEDGYCALELSSAGSFGLVREVFQTCPKRNEVLNGTITGAPNCLLVCDKGYEFQDPEVRRYCVPKGTGDTADQGFEEEMMGEDFEEEFFEEEFYEEEYNAAPLEDAVVYPAGYIKYRETRAGYDRVLNTEGLTGKDKSRAELINASSLRTVRDDMEGSSNSSYSDPEKDNFLNYILALRGTGKNNESQARSAGSDNSAGSQEGEIAAGQGPNGEFYGSAPLLPSTGSGMLWILAAIGIALMSFAVVRRN